MLRNYISYMGDKTQEGCLIQLNVANNWIRNSIIHLLLELLKNIWWQIKAEGYYAGEKHSTVLITTPHKYFFSTRRKLMNTTFMNRNNFHFIYNCLVP
ncbi:hypothetical protein EGR_05782 [Echinococcus granulosus]|uniref:Uncharacterized protein n=1 Tax=Echinococcus granulosus TaxID=6210 RepID=W6UE22_ECHGR|nr:hypothetical protein EGR_05782 [Echinococcus granulosus]EUB59298.1 hypothetical protein EGR_05782 [Echinococcus granulosus]